MEDTGVADNALSTSILHKVVSRISPAPETTWRSDGCFAKSTGRLDGSLNLSFDFLRDVDGFECLPDLLRMVCVNELESDGVRRSEEARLPVDG